MSKLINATRQWRVRDAQHQGRIFILLAYLEAEHRFSCSGTASEEKQREILVKTSLKNLTYISVYQ